MSGNVYHRILSDRSLGRRLLPEGIVRSPYEVLDYRATLRLLDARGLHASFTRRQRIRFIQNGVSAILDHAWGNGVLSAHYHNTAGLLEDSLRDGDLRHLVVGLRRRMARGDRLTFSVSRLAIAAFTQSDEWLQTTVDHPVQRIGCRVIFPKERRCLRATLSVGPLRVPLPVIEQGGHSVIAFETFAGQAHTPYTIHWSW